MLLALSTTACGRVNYDPLAAAAGDASLTIDAPTTGGPLLDAGAVDVTPAAPLPDAVAVDVPLADASVDRAPPDAPCPWPSSDRLLAEWRAEGTAANEARCSPWQATPVGNVPYGAGQQGQAWYFRSDQASSDSDPDYVSVPAAAGYTMASLSVDVWVRQTSFNGYPGSNRFIAGTGWPGFANSRPGDWAMYVHEGRGVFFFMRVGADYNQGTDYDTCQLAGSTQPLGTWERYTATYDGQALRCYRNGQLLSTDPLPARAAAMPVRDLSVGRNYPGDIDALRIFDRALSAAEISRTWP